jgi:hypothetical protein
MREEKGFAIAIAIDTRLIDNQIYSSQ